MLLFIVACNLTLLCLIIRLLQECSSRPDPLGGFGNESGRDCSGRGHCDYELGRCRCHAGFHGEACNKQSILSYSNPSLFVTRVYRFDSVVLVRCESAERDVLKAQWRDCFAQFRFACSCLLNWCIGALGVLNGRGDTIYQQSLLVRTKKK